LIHAAIDVGSNSVRMLLQPVDKNILFTPKYFRQVTRLAGGFNPESGLAPKSMIRTLDALAQFAEILRRYKVEKIKAVGTEVLRQAINSSVFIEKAKKQTDLSIEIIDGEAEAGLSCRGILSVLNPQPERALLFDLGGGSTEIILLDKSKVCLQKSLPLGVVRLFEDHPDSIHYIEEIQRILTPFIESSLWCEWQQDAVPIELVGTAGTVTTLAALKLEMDEYDGSLVSNLVLEKSWIEKISILLKTLPLKKRVELPGMEEGRADVIVAGVQIVSCLLDIVGRDSLRVVDAGLLEGLLQE
jgi:exopolyphosphatase/guanosine-5'-triphosphate,3'-diphosphate pyrophosphatase